MPDPGLVRRLLTEARSTTPDDVPKMGPILYFDEATNAYRVVPRAEWRRDPTCPYLDITREVRLLSAAAKSGDPELSGRAARLAEDLEKALTTARLQFQPGDATDRRAP